MVRKGSESVWRIGDLSLVGTGEMAVERAQYERQTSEVTGVMRQPFGNGPEGRPSRRH